MWHHIIFFARYRLIPIWRAENDLSLVFFILHVYINAGEFVASWSHTQHLINSKMVTIFDCEDNSFYRLPKILDKWISERQRWEKLFVSENALMKVYQWVKINTSSGLSTARITGLRYFDARHSQFRFLFIIYSFPLPGAKHAHLN